MLDMDSEAIQSTEAAQADYPTPPDLHIPQWSSLIGTATTTSPHLLAKLSGPSDDLSVSSISSGAGIPCHDFYRSASWAPDGGIILAITESQQKHLLHCSRQPQKEQHSTGYIKRFCELKSPSPLLDAIWYPMPALEQPSEVGTQDPTATWCFAESHRDLPIRLTGSSDGRARASYSIMNHVEKFVGPHSLAFSPDLSRLYCGLWSSLAVFPLSRPGLNTQSQIPLVSGKRSVGGQRGIISALAVTVTPSAPTSELVAVGSFSGTVGIYSFDPATFPEPTEHTASHAEESLAQSSCMAGWREIEGDGITQLRFHPLSPYVLFVASRRSEYIYVYDIRYLMGDTSRWNFRPLAQAAAGVRTAHLLAKLKRPSTASQQRVHFDLDWAGRWLASGDEDGMIHVWRIDTGRFTDESDLGGQNTASLMPDLSWEAHQDVVGSVAFHPYEPWLLSVSGSRQWPEPASTSDSDSEETSDDASQPSNEGSGRHRAWSTTDSSLKIWDFSHPPTPMT